MHFKVQYDASKSDPELQTGLLAILVLHEEYF